MQILEHILKIRREKEKHEFSQMVFRIAKWFFALPNGFSHCQMVFRIAKWIFALPNGFSHCQMVFSHCAVVFRIAKFRIAKFATHCELIAKIPTVLPSDFVLRITFSSELRFRRFWYRWKS